MIVTSATVQVLSDLFCSKANKLAQCGDYEKDTFRWPRHLDCYDAV
jgi:hypothetical protein